MEFMKNILQDFKGNKPADMGTFLYEGMLLIGDLNENIKYLGCGSICYFKS